MKNIVPSILMLFGVLTCAENKQTPVAAKRTTLDIKAAVGEKLMLSWSAQSPVTSYHIFYKNGSKDLEIDSLQSGDKDFASPKLYLDNSNMESWPAKGGKACFYVIAENAGALSEASDTACATM